MIVRIGKRNWDANLLGTWFLLMAIGLANLYSAIHSGSSGLAPFYKQLLWVGLGMAVLAGIVLMPMRLFYRAAYPVYAATLVLLVVVLFWGTGRVHRWIGFEGVYLQPSEFAKWACILVLARLLSQEKKAMDWKKGLKAALLVLVPCLLILREPDVGTVLVFIPLTLVMLIWAGMRMRFLLIFALPLLALFSGFHWIGLAVFMVLLTAGLGLARIRWQYSFILLALCLGVGLMAPMAWNRLEPYQQQRMLIYLGMKSDPHGAAYQVIQSKVAIGSGGILGKGFLHGSQTQLRFLPEQHTDFVFSVLGEEFGFLGVSVVLGLFIGLILRMITIARNTPDRFASFVAAGSASVIGFQTLVNIGMTLGLLPVTGVPLPFLSYGGSSLIAMCGLVGMTASGAGRLYDYS